MTIADRIIETLSLHPEGLDDDQLAEIIQLSARQQANIRCRALEKAGLVRRERISGKIRNFLTGKPIEVQSKTYSIRDDQARRHWYWEGYVQEKIMLYLTKNGFSISSSANTHTKERGVDIVAERNGEQLWVSVKGYPNGTPKTHPSVQAGHWFKQVAFDALSYRGESSSIGIGIGLPDFPRYRKMAEKISWFKPVGNFNYFWVTENGDVKVE